MRSAGYKLLKRIRLLAIRNNRFGAYRFILFRTPAEYL